MMKKRRTTRRRKKRYSNLPIRARLMSVTELMKLTKTQLINKIVSSIALLSKKKLAVMCYQIQKSKLPILPVKKRVWSQKQLAALKQIDPRFTHGPILPVKKRVWSQKQLAAQRLFAKRAKAGTLRRR